MSENNYGALMMKSALSASVDINTILLPGIYIIPPGSPSSPDQNGGILTVHHGQPKLRTFNSVYVISATSKYEQSSLKWGEWLYDVTKNQLASSDGFKLIGQVRSAAALALLPGSDGDRVLLASYHELTAAELPVGGGEFYYVSSLAGVNNGVTIFNGWRRKIINNRLTDHDAGCIKDDISDASSRLADLFSVIEDGMTIELHCLNHASRNFVIKNRDGIRITSVGYGGIYCWSARDDYTWIFDSDFESGNDGLTGSLGILSFYNCHDSQVDNTNITGVQLIHPLSNEWGDCGIRYENCQRFKTIDNILNHFGGWGIFGGFGSHDSKSHGNHVNHTHRQSGINIWANSNNCHAWGNYCFDNALYNFEFETLSNHDNSRTTGGSCKLNFGTLAKINIAVVGPMQDGLISGNILSLGVGSLAAIGVRNPLSTRIEISDNTCRSFWYAMTANNSRNVLFSKNTADYSEPDFLITDQYQAPVKLHPTDPYSFYCTLPIAPGKIIKIADSVYTVAASSAVSAQELFGQPKYYKLDTFYKITLTTPIQPDFHTFANILFAWSTLNTTNGTYVMITNNAAFSQGNVVDGAENVRFVKNIGMGTKFGINPGNTFSALTGVQEQYEGNTFDCESWLRTDKALSSHVAISGNEPTLRTSMTSIMTGSNTKNWKSTKTITINGLSGAVSGTAPQQNFFRVEKTCFVIGYRVILRNWSSAEDVKLILANSNIQKTITNAGAATETVTEEHTHLYALDPDKTYPLYLLTGSNVLTARWYSIEVFILE
ncbi:TPA: hypothetical protein ACM2MD_002099 [Raoultella planticola]